MDTWYVYFAAGWLFCWFIWPTLLNFVQSLAGRIRGNSAS